MAEPGKGALFTFNGICGRGNRKCCLGNGVYVSYYSLTLSSKRENQ